MGDCRGVSVDRVGGLSISQVSIALMKSGIKTSEFWAVAAASLLTVANQGFGLGLPPEAITTFAGLAGAYAVSRGLAKKPSA
jgi:hypothetical protein